MKIALITLSNEGAKLIANLLKGFPEADRYFHDVVESNKCTEKFTSIIKLTGRIFDIYDGLIYVAPTGVVVRAISGRDKSKKTDPAIVVLDVGGRHAISLLGGHERGANDLAVRIGNIIGSEPVITTTTEAVKTLIVGVGCRRGKESEKIIEAITKTLEDVSASIEDVRYIASADVKENEEGIIKAAEHFSVPLRFISSDEIRSCGRDFERSDFVMKKVGIPAVAEPSALLAGRRTKLIVQKRIFSGITVAIAKENCTSLE